MAVTFKTEANYGYKLMELFGVNASMVLAAKKAGITVDQTYPGSFHIMHNGMNFGAVVIKGQAISLVKSGSLGPSSKQAVSIQFEQALKKALQSAGVSPDDVVTPPKVSVGDTNFKPLLNADVSPITDAVIGAADTVKKSGLVVNKGASSSSAFYLKQKIAGTSNGSTYTVFAIISGGLALAGRVKNGILSVRAVFSDPKAGKAKFNSALLALGFTAKTAGPASYMSAHYSCGKQDLMVKTVGAIISTLGFDNVEGINLSEVLQ